MEAGKGRRGHLEEAAKGEDVSVPSFPLLTSQAFLYSTYIYV